MKHIRYAAAAALLAAVAACTATGSDDRPGAAPADDDGGAPVGDAANAPEEDARAIDAAPDSGEPDADRPLICGDAGFCETKLPTSETGLPLSLRSVWSVAENDVWSVTDEGLVLHYDGSTWKTEYHANHALSVVWATPTSVWVGGELGLLLNRNATGQWSQVETWHTSTIRTISGRSDVDVWFSRADGLVDHYDGTALKAHPIDIPDLRILTVFSGPSATYAAGFVDGPPATLQSGRPPNRYPYVLELTEDGATVFNAALPTTAAARGFVPVSAQVTDAPDDNQRIFLFGYFYTWNNYYKWFDLEGRYMLLGPSSPIKLTTVRIPNGRNRWTATATELPRSQPLWAKDWSNVVLPFSEPYVYIQLLRWDGATMTPDSLAMGRDFVPRDVFGIHGGLANSWIVGDGFALKGPTP